MRSAEGAGRAVAARLVTHRAIVIEATLSGAPEIFTFAHVYLLVSALWLPVLRPHLTTNATNRSGGAPDRFQSVKLALNARPLTWNARTV